MDMRRPLSAKDNSTLGPVAEQDGCWMYMNSTSALNNKGEQTTVLMPSYVPNGVDPRTMAPNMYPLDTELIKSLWHPWDQLLRFHTMEEQFRLIANTFGPDTVNYVFKDLDTEQFIPMDIQQCGYGRYESLIKVPRQRQTAAAIAPGSVAPGLQNQVQAPAAPTTPTPAPAMAPANAPTFRAPGGVDVPMVTATPHPAPQKPVVPPSMQAQVEAAKAAARNAGVRISAPPIPGSTPDLNFGSINMPKVPPIPAEGATEEELQDLINGAK